MKTQCGMHFILRLQQMRTVFFLFFLIKSEGACACI